MQNGPETRLRLSYAFPVLPQSIHMSKNMSFWSMKTMRYTSGYMNTRNVLFASAVLFYSLLSHINTAEAYFTTAQKAVKINETHALFIVEYTFGLKNEDLFMPGVASHKLLTQTKSDKVGFEIIADGRDEVDGKEITSAILSKAPSQNGQYKVVKGTSQKFWLVALLETEKDTLETDYALKVTHLPFFVDTGESTLDTRQLNPTELQYYLTKEVELNTGNYTK